jgi:tetratricopeptide (TPR) repeat protein
MLLGVTSYAAQPRWCTADDTTTAPDSGAASAPAQNSSSAPAEHAASRGQDAAPSERSAKPAPGLDEAAPVSSAAEARSTSASAVLARRGPRAAGAPHGPALGADPAPAATAPVAAFSAPSNLDDIGAWLEYRAHNHIGALPQEARIFYRRGLELENNGNFEDAVRLVRGACDLDAEYVAPHLTLASWFVLRDPSQALLQIAAALELSRQNFVLQLSLLANLLVLLIQSVFLGLLAAALLVVVLRNAQLRHLIQERLGLFVELRGARVWAWGLLILPFLAGLGLALPALVLLGLMWSALRLRERLVFIGLTLMIAAAPWLVSSIDRLSLPLRPEEAPFFGIPMLASEPYTAERQQQVAELAERHPDDPFAQFALGWLARRGGDLQLAERAYRRALQIWPHDDRVLNNLGNTLAMQGRADEALTMYQRAYADAPRNAAAYFNASQIFTQRFEYKAANDALSRASALNFDLVKAYQAQATEDGLLPLVDQWLAPQTFWSAIPVLQAGAFGAATLPPGWRSKWESSGWVFSALALLLAIGAVLIGRRMHQDMPLRECNNCGCVVCRRCAERRRETALCATCAAVESQAESTEFARVLLMQRRRSVTRRWEMLRTALATLIPGFGLLALDRLFMPLVLLSTTAGLCARWLGLSAPFSHEPRLLQGAGDGSMWVRIAAWLLIYAISLLGYLVARTHTRERAETPEVAVRPRGGEPPRRTTAAAA